MIIYDLSIYLKYILCYKIIAALAFNLSLIIDIVLIVSSTKLQGMVVFERTTITIVYTLCNRLARGEFFNNF